GVRVPLPLPDFQYESDRLCPFSPSSAAAAERASRRDRALIRRPACRRLEETAYPKHNPDDEAAADHLPQGEATPCGTGRRGTGSAAARARRGGSDGDAAVAGKALDIIRAGVAAEQVVRHGVPPAVVMWR